MVTRLLGALLVVWSATTALAASDSEPPASPAPKHAGPEQAAKTEDGPTAAEDDELIRNLDLIEHLDLLDTLDVIGTLKTPESAEEEF